MNKFNKLSPKAKQKLVGLVSILHGIIFYNIMHDEWGWGALSIMMGIFFLLTKKQYLEFD